MLEDPDLPARADVVVIGAGQAGLAVAYHLVRRGLVPGRDFVVLDRGPRTGGAWQHRWEALRLGDTHKVHDLPGMREAGFTFADAPTHLPARDVVAAYYARFERHYGLGVVRPAPVSSVERVDGGGYRVTVGGAQVSTAIEARVVVNATGTWGNPRVPAIPGRLEFAGRQLTTASWVDADELRGLRVAVVGGGTSALGFLDELLRVDAETLWFTRREVHFIDEEPWLSETRGARAVQLQDEAAREGRVLPSIVSSTGVPRSPLVDRLEQAGALHRRPMFRRIVTDGIVDADGNLERVDAIVWATGFRAELRHLEPLGVVGVAGAVAVESGQVVGEPTLFLAGYGPQASTVSSNRAGRVTAKLVMGLVGGHAPHESDDTAPAATVTVAEQIADPSPEPPRRILGRTGLEVSAVCVGTAAWGVTSPDHGTTVPEEQAIATALAAFDGPLNYLDTSNNYGGGESERRIGLAIERRGGLPAGFILQTKLDRDPDTGSFDADALRRSLETSLARLHLDRVPVLLLHDPEHIGFDAAMEPGGAVETTLRLRDEGYCDWVGVGGAPVGMLTSFVETGMFDVLLTHNRYTLVDRSAHHLLSQARDHGMGVLNAAVYAGGILASWPRTTDLYGYGAADPELLERIDAMGAACHDAGVTLRQAALQFSLRDQRIDSTICGVESPAQLDELIADATAHVPDELWARLDELAPPPAAWRGDWG